MVFSSPVILPNANIIVGRCELERPFAIQPSTFAVPMATCTAFHPQVRVPRDVLVVHPSQSIARSACVANAIWRRCAGDA